MTNKLSVSGSAVMKIGCCHVRFVKVFSTVYGNGGSGEPMTREVVHGIRLPSPNGGPAAAWRSGKLDISQVTAKIGAITERWNRNQMSAELHLRANEKDKPAEMELCAAKK